MHPYPVNYEFKKDNIDIVDIDAFVHLIDVDTLQTVFCKFSYFYFSFHQAKVEVKSSAQVHSLQKVFGNFSV